ncbi:TPA: phage late control D family protein [Morganella morganii]|nr:phage late control D family protein [Morganella morganii]HDF2366321.1 phage late control D family protein [Morganella morganii]HDF2424525.1 phage late control D family protein [Morganella morganii]
MTDFFLTGSECAPAYSLSAGSVNINERIQGRLISLSLTDNRGFEADQLDIEIDDADGKMMLPKRGEVLSLHLGWKNEALIFKGKFTVDEIEHSGPPDKLTIRGRSADFRSSLNVKREVSYHEKTLGDIITTIAKRNNVEPVIEKTLAEIKIAHIDQTNESDGSFLARLGKQEGAVAAVKNGQLLFMPQGSGKTASGKPIPALLITRSVGDGYRFSLADRGAYTGVIASWLNTRKPERKDEVKVKRKLKPGKNKNQEKSQKQNEPQGDYLVGEEGNVLTLSHTYANKNNAERAAKAAWEKMQRGVASLSIQLAKGRADIYPEMPVKVQGFKPEIDGAEWILTKVSHSLNDSGFTSALEFEVKIADVEMSDG